MNVTHDMSVLSLITGASVLVQLVMLFVLLFVMLCYCYVMLFVSLFVMLYCCYVMFWCYCL